MRKIFTFRETKTQKKNVFVRQKHFFCVSFVFRYLQKKVNEKNFKWSFWPFEYQIEKYLNCQTSPSFPF